MQGAAHVASQQHHAVLLHVLLYAASAEPASKTVSWSQCSRQCGAKLSVSLRAFNVIIGSGEIQVHI